MTASVATTRPGASSTRRRGYTSRRATPPQGPPSAVRAGDGDRGGRPAGSMQRSRRRWVFHAECRRLRSSGSAGDAKDGPVGSVAREWSPGVRSTSMPDRSTKVSSCAEEPASVTLTGRVCGYAGEGDDWWSSEQRSSRGPRATSGHELVLDAGGLEPRSKFKAVDTAAALTLLPMRLHQLEWSHPELPGSPTLLMTAGEAVCSSSRRSASP